MTANQMIKRKTNPEAGTILWEKENHPSQGNYCETNAMCKENIIKSRY